jgi:hypothetical protein
MMPSKLGSYWALSRAPRYSVTFALPLLLLYEALAASLSRFAGEQMRNGADVMLRSLFIAVSPLAILGAQPKMGVGARLMLSLGAGLYEELLFRVLLVSGLLLLARRVMRLGPGLANTFAVGLAALIFSAFHYIGPFGDPLRLDSFVFRTIAGIAFSALYVFRGFGITAWTHALYDVIVLVL